jgi:hypothetical protein
MLKRFCATLVVLASGCGSATPPPAEPVKPGASAGKSRGEQLVSVRLPGTRVTLKLPRGYVRPTRSALLLRGDDAVRILIQDFNDLGDGAQSLAGLKNALLQQTEGSARFEPIRRSGAEGFRVSGRSAQGELRGIVVTTQKFVSSVLVLCRRDVAEAERIVELAEFHLEAEANALELLGLELELGDRFEVLTLAAQAVILPKGLRPPFPDGTPRLVVAALPHPRGMPLDERSRGQLLGGAIEAFQPDMPRAKVAAVRVDGANATELVVPGSDQNQNKPVIVYGLVLPDEHDTLLMFGTAGNETTLDELRALARSLHRKPGIVGRLEPD